MIVPIIMYYNNNNNSGHSYATAALFLIGNMKLRNISEGILLAIAELLNNHIPLRQQ